MSLPARPATAHSVGTQRCLDRGLPVTQSDVITENVAGGPGTARACGRGPSHTLLAHLPRVPLPAPTWHPPGLASPEGPPPGGIWGARIPRPSQGSFPALTSHRPWPWQPLGHREPGEGPPPSPLGRKEDAPPTPHRAPWGAVPSPPLPPAAGGFSLPSGTGRACTRDSSSQ